MRRIIQGGIVLFFDKWNDIFRIVVMALIIYPALIFILRISGKRTLSKMNMFDLVVTVALGSTVATILLSSAVSLWEGITALFLLVFLQYAVAWLQVRSNKFTAIVKGEPQLLFFNGTYLESALKAERVKADEVRQAVRTSGSDSMEDIEAVVLETDGSISVMKKSDQKREKTAIDNVNGMDNFK
ncbi:Protein of unknown function [Halobacillus dabanensis]|uniref:DUF421 domain-containing protein n=1 Tax=Halobacillus dabanensis TaxID=240302 RepID=A0A1I3P0X7_HALDA|nr:Protein of unknown function [Halobacillus dabanensis]